jgi:hypothetical protein
MLFCTENSAVKKLTAKKPLLEGTKSGAQRSPNWTLTHGMSVRRKAEIIGKLRESIC